MLKKDGNSYQTFYTRPRPWLPHPISPFQVWIQLPLGLLVFSTVILFGGYQLVRSAYISRAWTPVDALVESKRKQGALGYTASLAYRLDGSVQRLTVLHPEVSSATKPGDHVPLYVNPARADQAYPLIYWRWIVALPIVLWFESLLIGMLFDIRAANREAARLAGRDEA